MLYFILMKSYQFIFIVPVGDKKVCKQLKELIAELKGKLNKEEFLGKKELAYQVDKQNEGDYYRFFIEIDSTKLPEFKKELKQKQLTLRYLLIRAEE